MDEAAMLPLWMIRVHRRLHVGAVERHPEVLGLPDVRERLVHARVLAIVPQRLLLVDLHHARARNGSRLPGGLARRDPVPTGRIVLVSVQEAPDQLLHGTQILGRHGIGDHHVALLREPRQIGIAEHPGPDPPFAGHRLVRQLHDLGSVHYNHHRTLNRAMISSTQA